MNLPYVDKSTACIVLLYNIDALCGRTWRFVVLMNVFYIPVATYVAVKSRIWGTSETVEQTTPSVYLYD